MPFFGLLWLVAGTAGTLIRPPSGPWWWVVAGLTVVGAALLVTIAVRARSARRGLAAAFQTAYVPGAAPRATRVVWWRLVLPMISWRPDVRRVRNVRYLPSHRRGHRLDVYLSRRHRRPEAPVLIFFHGSHSLGSKMLGARPLLYRLAADGWVCVSAGRRQFRTGDAEQLADARAAMAWVHDNAATHGADPGKVFVAGGSAGANLAATAALSGGSVRAVIGLSGYYGDAGACATSDAPPFLIVHGALDTLVMRQDARAFADRLASVSARPVVYAELPGAHHNFDFFQSLRVHAVTDAIVTFANLTLGTECGGSSPS